MKIISLILLLTCGQARHGEGLLQNFPEHGSIGEAQQGA